MEHAEGYEEHTPPKIDVSKALHEAGHEVEDLGFTGLPDTGPVIHAAEHHQDTDAQAAMDAIVIGGTSD